MSLKLRKSRPEDALDFPLIPDDAFIIWSHNGKPWPDAARVTSFLSKTQRHTLQGWALFTNDWRDSVAFVSEDDALNFLRRHNERRSTHPYKMNVTTVREYKRAAGFAKWPAVALHCRTCKGKNLTFDANASWDVIRQDYVLSGVMDDAYCEDCDGETRAVERHPDDASRVVYDQHPARNRFFGEAVAAHDDPEAGSDFGDVVSKWVKVGLWQAHRMNPDGSLGDPLPGVLIDQKLNLHRDTE